MYGLNRVFHEEKLSISVLRRYSKEAYTVRSSLSILLQPSSFTSSFVDPFPRPLPNLRHILTILSDVLLVVNEPVSDELFAIGDGWRITVIGGGPAGSFSAFYLLQMADQAGLDFGVKVFGPSQR